MARGVLQKASCREIGVLMKVCLFSFSILFMISGGVGTISDAFCCPRDWLEFFFFMILGSPQILGTLLVVGNAMFFCLYY